MSEEICGYVDNSINFHHFIDNKPKDTNFLMHIHDSYEIFCFISGDAKYLVEGNEYTLESGCILLMRDCESHKVKILSDKQYERYTIHFSQALLNNIDPENRLTSAFKNRALGKMNLYHPSEFRNERPIDFFESMSIIDSDSENHRLQITTRLFTFLYEINHAFINKQNSFEENNISNRIEPIVSYINKHLFDNLSLDFLSNRFFISKSQLGRLFKYSTGSTVWEYIMLKRLLVAKRQIKDGIPATKVALSCGFKEYSSFYRAYLKQFKISPQKDFYKDKL